MAERRPLILLAVLLGVAAAAAGPAGRGHVRASSIPPAVVPSPDPVSSVERACPGADLRSLVTRLNDEGVVLYEIGRLSDALAKFEEAVAADGADPAVRRNLAWTKTRLAWGRLEQGDADEALRIFEQANRLQPGEGTILLGLGVTYHQQGNEPQAQALLGRALEADPNQALALKLLGEIAYRRDNLQEAGVRFERALRLDPSDVAVRERLERVQVEIRDQTGSRKIESRHFTVRFEGREDPTLAWVILERLESAYQDVGRRLGAFPESKVQVVLYTDRAFQEQASAPDWAQGIFDGKIRLAVSGAMRYGEGLDKVLRHEYTHALVHARARGNVPTWLSEGLAVMNEGLGTEHERNLARAADRLIPLDELHGSFLNLPSTQVQLAYAESAAAVDYLLSRHGAPKVRTLLARLGESRDFAAAFQKAVGIPYTDFQAVWMRSVIDYPGAGS